MSAGLAGVGALPPPASAWPEAEANARFNTLRSASSATAVIGPRHPTVQWQVTLNGDATPGPAIAADGSILAATNAGYLYDLDPASGRRRWVFDGHGSYGNDLSTSPAVLGNGTILWPGSKGILFALDPSGRLLWQHAFAGQVLSPAIAGNHRVYVADLVGDLAAFDVSTRVPQLVWQLNVGGPDYASPSIGANGTIYTAANHDLAAVRDLGNHGAVAWRLHTNKLIEVSNAVAPNGDVVLGTNHDREYGVRPDGRIAWSFDVGDYTYSSASIGPDALAYFGDNTGRVRVVDTRTGTVLPTIAPLGDGKEKVWSAVIADARGNFYWATTEGHVYGYTRDGRQLFHLGVNGGVNSYPALGNRATLYLGTTTGHFYAIG